MKLTFRFLALFALAAQPAYAGSLAVTPGSGATVGTGSDGTNQIPATILCGASASATLYATCVNQAIVNASGQLLTLNTQSGTWTVGISGTVTVTGTVTANVAGSLSSFTPSDVYAGPYSITTTSSALALPSGTAAGSTLMVYNKGPNFIFYNFGTSGVTATNADAQLAPLSWTSITVPSGVTNFAAIVENSNDSASVTLSLGTGTPTGNGGPEDLAVIVEGGTSATYVSMSGGADNSDTAHQMQVTAPGTAATSYLLGVQGSSSGVPIPVSAASLPLPTGAATDAHLTNVQSAVGTSAATAVTIQGSASGVAIPVTGTLSASVGGFTPTPAYATPLSVSGTSARVALPTGTAVIAYNVGANAAYCTTGSGSVTATTSDDVIQPNSWIEYTVGSAVDIACITSTSTTTVNLSGGAGLMTGAGGGSGGSGGGGAITAASGAYASGSISAGAIASGAAVSGAFVAGSIADLAHGQGTMANSVPVAIASNQSTLSVNTAQVNGVTTLTGTGAVGTGTQRVAVGTDTATIAGSAPSTVLQTNNAQWGGTAITNVPTAVGTAGTGNTPTVNAYIVGGGGSGGTSAADNSSWTAGTTNMTIEGCEYTSGGATAITTAHAAAIGCTSARAAFSDLSSVAGTALSAAVSAYGTAPTGTEVMGVNAYVTNTNANGSATSANSSPVVIASDQAAVAVKAASGAFASGSIASGALASGSIASGAAVSGAFASGALTDVTNVTGSKAAGTAAADSLLTGSVYNTTAPAPTNGQQVALQADPNGNLRTAPQCNKVLNIAQTATTDVHTFTGFGYICSIVLTSATQQNIGVDEGTGTTCESSGTALIGVSSTSAATPVMAVAQYGGFSSVASVAWLRTQTSADHLCVLQSGSGEVAGTITYADLAN